MKALITIRSLKALGMAVCSYIIIAHTAFATETQEQIADCKKIGSYAQAGQKAYDAGDYNKAREAFRDQAAWSHSCYTLFQDDPKSFAISDSAVATADNNVALTYIKQKEFLKAKAWLMINPDDKKSQYNLNLIKAEIAKLPKSKSPVGEYWQYAGNGAWNIIGVARKGSQYDISFFGLYMGLMSMYYGPNMGEFSLTSPIKNGTAVYSDNEDGEGCQIDMQFKADSVQLKSTRHDCGFGHNVYADGDFQRVSDDYTTPTNEER